MRLSGRVDGRALKMRLINEEWQKTDKQLSLRSPLALDLLKRQRRLTVADPNFNRRTTATYSSLAALAILWQPI